MALTNARERAARHVGALLRNRVAKMGGAVQEARIASYLPTLGQFHRLTLVELPGEGGGIGLLRLKPQRLKRCIEH